jgi:hypothetical protein
MQLKMKELSRKTQMNLATLARAITDPDVERGYPYLQFVVLGFLFLAGIILWMYFFDYGKTALNFKDWDGINIPRLVFLSQAYRSYVIPWHMQYTPPLHNTDRFFSVPDVITSPQTLLLYFMKVRYFVYFDILLNYSIAMISIFWIKKLLKLSLAAIVFFFFLFVFNGYIVAHFSNGHFTWMSHFLFPLFFGLMILLSRGVAGWRWVAATAFLMFYMVLDGGEHQFVWLLIFMCLMIPFHWKQAKWLFAAILFSGLLSAIRLLPPVVELPHYSWATGAVPAGYPSVMSLVQAMIQLVGPGSNLGDPLFVYYYHEFSLYVGVIGFIFICGFGIFMWAKNLANKGEFSGFVFPVIGMIFLSLSDTYSIVKAIPFPLFGGERVSTRMIDVPFVFLLMVAVYYFQKWLNNRKDILSMYAVSIGMLVFIIHDLMKNLELWSIRNMASLSPLSIMDYSQLTLVGNHPDPVYLTVFYLGLAITLISLVVLLYLSVREHRQKRVLRNSSIA